MVSQEQGQNITRRQTFLPRDAKLIKKVNSKVKRKWIKRLDKSKTIYAKEGEQTEKGQRKVTVFFDKKSSEEIESDTEKACKQDRSSNRGNSVRQGTIKSGKGISM